MMERNAWNQGRTNRWKVAIAIVLGWLASGFFELPVEFAAAQAPQPQLARPLPPFVQFGRPRRVQAGDATDTDGTDGLFLPQDRDATRQLDRAKQLLEDGRYSDAATLLDDILKRGEDYFFKPADSQQTHRSLKMEAQRLIGNMPVEGQKAYELQFGTRAAQMLSQAAEEGDVAKLEALTRRFFHTQAGYQATLLLGRHYLDHSQPLAAAFCFQRLLDTPQAAAQFEPGLSVIASIGWLRGGIPERAGDVLAALRKQSPKATVRIGSMRVPSFPDSRTAVAWLRSAIGESKASRLTTAEGWVMHRGNPSRNSISSGGIPLLNPRWRVSTTNHPLLEKMLVETRKRYAEDGVPSLPVMQPLAVGDLVLMRTPREVLAVDFASGKRLWPIRTNDLSWGPQQPSDLPLVPAQGVEQQVHSALTERLWVDATQGTMSSDGQRLFLVQESIERADRRNGADARFQMQYEFARPYNRLTACELSTQGKLKWQVGGSSGEDEPQLAGAFFLGPPLPLQGLLYVLTEINGEIKLCVLDASTGKLQWWQQLAIVEQTIMQDSLRMLAGCTPSFADGILICPTTAGAVVAVDTTNRSLLWAFQYPRNLQTYQNGIVFRPNPFGVQAVNGGGAERWCDSSTIIADGRVVVSPLESDELHCLSLVDGKPLWKSVARGENLYVGGVHAGKVIVVGKRGVTALRLADGQPAWQQPVALPDRALPSGRGYLSGNEYYLPLTTAEVVKIDLVKERITQRAKSRHGSIPGNLICYRGEVISQGVDYLESFYQLEPLQIRIAETLKGDSDNAWALAHRSEIALSDSELGAAKLEQAVADIRRAYQLDPSPFTRDLFVEALTTALAQDFGKYQSLVAELEPLVQFDAERAWFLRVVAAGLQQQGHTVAALEAYLKLAQLPTPPDDELDGVEADRSVRRDRWIRAKLNELIAAASTDERTKVDAAIDAQLQAAIAEQGVRPLRQFLGYFSDHPAAERAREMLVEQISGSVALLQREQMLRKLELSSDTSRRKDAAVKLAALLRDAGQEQDALAYYRRLAKEFDDAPLVDRQSIAKYLESLPSESPLRRAQTQSSGLPAGEVIAKKDSRSGRNHPSLPFQPLEFRGPRGPFFEDLTIGYQQSGGELVARDGWGIERFRVSLNDGQRGYNIVPSSACLAAYGHLLVLCTGNQVMGIDTLRSTEGAAGRILWRQEIGDGNTGTVYFNGGGRVRIAARVRNGAQPAQLGCLGPAGANGVFMQRGREVMALDPLSGKPLWTRQVEWQNCEIFGDDELILVAPPEGNDAKALVLRAIDGFLLGKCVLPASNQRWMAYGRCVLAWTPLADGQQQLRLVDPWGNRDLWNAKFSVDAKSTVVDDETVAIMQRDGRLVMLSLADGRITIDEKLAPEPNLENIYVVRSSEHDLLVVDHSTSDQPAANRGRRTILAQLDGIMPTVTGRIYAFNRATGKLQWATPGSVEEHGLLLSQPSKLPVLLFLRMVTDSNGSNGNPRGSILCLDKQTGRLIFEDDDLQQVAAFEATTDFENKVITIHVLQQSVTLKFTGNPVPPEPPYQAGLGGSQWDLTNTIENAWQKATEPEKAPVKINRDPFAPAQPK
ncbi:MAG: PQQ-binding-like beta-propeller repeat protein [Pirellulales bacterium]|nr:PQQ-binding-like beta-propeller repeat protein [Pirellulales bacterium]